MDKTGEIEVIRVESTDSTNSQLAAIPDNESRIRVLVASYQTAGRGMDTNRWASEAGQNLLFSVRIRPVNVPPTRQFVLLEAMALAVRDVIEETLENSRTRELENLKAPQEPLVTIKWPNDIYVGDRKICGTLSECSVHGRRISRCILGSGVNINQTEFPEWVPNPVSLKMLTGRDYDKEEILSRIIERFSGLSKTFDNVDNPDKINNLDNIDIIENIENAAIFEPIHRRYKAHLYRREGFHLYNNTARGDFEARIFDITDSGHLILEDREGRREEYALKEVNTII